METSVVQCRCEHPTIIISPLLPELLAKYRNYTIRGKEYIISKSYKSLLYGTNKSKFSVQNLHITEDDLCSCYVTDYRNNKTYPIYLAVPCGHCEICRHAKVTSLVQRCKLETMMYNCKPIFLTLTYDDLHKKECGVCLRDVQLFFKRLRINLCRKGYREKIRYVLVSEYGKRTSRPHYHAILWNLHASSLVSYREIRDIIAKSWSYGFCMLRLVDPSNDKGFYYTAKYLSKDSNVPRGCNKTFCVSSNRGGSIGAPWFYSQRRHVAETLNTNLKYVNKWSHKVAAVQLNRYALNKLLPSFSRSLPYSIKKRVRRFVLYYSYLRELKDINYLSFKETFNRVMCIFPKYMYIETFDHVRHNLIDVPFNSMLRFLLEDEERILRVIDRDLDYYYYLSQRRDVFIEKLLRTVVSVDLTSLSYKYRIEREYAAQREVL